MTLLRNTLVATIYTSVCTDVNSGEYNIKCNQETVRKE